MLLHYFAYGSNMSSVRLRERVPSARPIASAILAEHRLCFHKYSHVDLSAKCDAWFSGNPEERIYGVLYQMHAGDKANLDAAEGLGLGYEQKTVTLGVNSRARNEDTIVQAFTYYATDIRTDISSFDWYKFHVLKGAYEHQLPPDYIRQLASHISEYDKDKDRRLRELRIYR